MITDKDYSYVDPEFVGDDKQALSEIRIDADNAWHGVQLKISRISAEVIEGTDEAQLSYTFDVTNQDPDVAKELEEDSDFQNYIGDIIVHVIQNAFDNGDYRIGGDDDTDNDTSEPSTQ